MNSQNSFLALEYGDRFWKKQFFPSCILLETLISCLHYLKAGDRLGRYWMPGESQSEIKDLLLGDWHMDNLESTKF